jgi:hypothetical protein
MPKLRLTNAAVERFQPPPSGQVEYYDIHLPAFGLRVSYSGSPKSAGLLSANSRRWDGSDGSPHWAKLDLPLDIR